MGTFTPGDGIPRRVISNFEERGRKERAKIHFPVRVKYRLREDHRTGYLELTFDEETVDKIRRLFGIGDNRAVFLQCRMAGALLHVKSDPTGQIGYKLSGDRTLQVSSLQTANIPEPPDDEVHLAGVVMELQLSWTMDATCMAINIPPTLFRRVERGGTGKKLKAKKE